MNNGELQRGGRPRRGGVYIAVLGVSSLLAVVTVAGIAVSRLAVRRARLESEMGEARSYAVSAVELGRLMIARDPAWRSAKNDGVWVSSAALGAGTVSLEANDPGDADLGNRPHDPLVLRGTGACGGATQLVEATLVARAAPLPVLRSAVHAAGGITLAAGSTLEALGGLVTSGATVTCSGATINGSVKALAVVNVGGKISGTTTILAVPPALPPASVVDLYAAMGALVSTTTVSQDVLSPGGNPWGPANADGVYVILTPSDVVIRDVRILGTLVVRCPGRQVTIDKHVLIEPARPDYPALIIEGDALFLFDGAAGGLAEAEAAVNFNPPHAPFQGASDADQLDVYDSEIRGLVHVTGAVQLGSTSRIEGALLCTSAAITAVSVSGTPLVQHDPALVASPPQGYAESVTMVPAPGGWKRVLR